MTRNAGLLCSGKLPTCFCIALLLLPCIVFAADMLQIEVNHQGQRYNVNLVATVSLSVDEVRQLIGDFENLPDINPSILEAEILDSSANGQRVRLVTEACIWWICRNLTHVQDFVWQENGDLSATIVPEMSDFRSGSVTWTVATVDDQTVATMTSEIVPGFRIPPLIGPHIIRQAMRTIAINTIRGMETHARQER